MHPLRGRRRARIQGARFDGRSRHRARRRRPRHLARDPQCVRGERRRAGGLSQAAAGARRRGGGRAGRGRARRRKRRRDRLGARARTVRGDAGRGAGDPDRVGKRLRQAHLVVRVPGHRTWRKGDRGDGGQRAQRRARRLLPGREFRRDHAGHRWRAAHPRAGRRDPRRRPGDPGRDRVPHRRGGAGRLGRPDQRDGRGRGGGGVAERGAERRVAELRVFPGRPVGAERCRSARHPRRVQTDCGWTRLFRAQNQSFQAVVRSIAGDSRRPQSAVRRRDPGLAMPV